MGKDLLAGYRWKICQTYSEIDDLIKQSQSQWYAHRVSSGGGGVGAI